MIQTETAPAKPWSATPLLKVHRRQFVIGPRAYLSSPDWEQIKLSTGQTLSVDPELRVGRATDLNGNGWILLGLAVETRSDFANPLKEIAQRQTAAIPALYQGWAGRWILVGNNGVHPDGAAMLSCYYGQDAAGEVWASSSPVLIQQALEKPTSTIGKGEHDAWQPSASATVTGQVRGISWYPPPHSAIPSVFRLLPTQVLNLHRGDCHPRALVPPLSEVLSTRQLDTGSLDIKQMPPGQRDHAICAVLQQRIQTALTNLAELNAPRPLTLLLSGGRDSRLMLSIAANAGLPVETYTRLHRRATLADRLLPPKLARIADYPHRKQYQREEIPGRRQMILAHAGYNLSWLSAEEFLRGGSDPLTGIAIAGFCAALGRDRLIPTASAKTATGAAIAAHFCETSPELIAAFDAWVTLRQKDADSCLDLCDYFFLEQRTGGRKGIKEQIFDLFRAERVAPLNCAHIYALIGSLSPEFKLNAQWIPHTIQATTPALLKYPMNPPNRYFGLLRNRLFNNRFYRRQLGFMS